MTEIAITETDVHLDAQLSQDMNVMIPNPQTAMKSAVMVKT